ncbi:protein of unknown function [Pseudonocardia thermophila]|uniref:DUF1707 domain-containing protein n=1 Tax=Pseudonocardia thermophila TaxID=1848 RepID=A0A1M6ZP10_PSETH|nr:DUF1707 domain-containing protein [Pseudonocardia thermophila]SHL32187.1 protein of unknown function [Pseudonocardia thermophila]
MNAEPVNTEQVNTEHVNTAPGNTEQRVRIGDAEREQAAARLREAVGAGYLTVGEADERLAAAYAATTRAELDRLTADLPAPASTTVPLGPGGLTPAARRRLAIHAAIIGVLLAGVAVRWVLVGGPFFWPIGPLVFLLGTLALHYALARRPTWSELAQSASRGTTAA